MRPNDLDNVRLVINAFGLISQSRKLDECLIIRLITFLGLLKKKILVLIHIFYASKHLLKY